jgi:hypothetical protein
MANVPGLLELCPMDRVPAKGAVAEEFSWQHSMAS